MIGVDYVDQVMRGGGALGGSRLGGADVHMAVDLARVGRDDLAAERLGQRDRQGGLAGRGRADDRQQRDGRLS